MHVQYYHRTCHWDIVRHIDWAITVTSTFLYLKFVLFLFFQFSISNSCKVSLPYMSLGYSHVIYVSIYSGNTLVSTTTNPKLILFFFVLFHISISCKGWPSCMTLGYSNICRWAVHCHCHLSIFEVNFFHFVQFSTTFSCQVLLPYMSSCYNCVIYVPIYWGNTLVSTTAI